MRLPKSFVLHCVSCSHASAWLQVMAEFQKGHSLGQDWYIGSVRDSLRAPSFPKNSFTLAPGSQPCLALLFAALPRPCSSPVRQQHGALENPWVLEWLLERFLLPHLFSRPSSAPSLAPQAIFLHYPWLRQPKQFLQQYWCLRWIPHYISPPVLILFFYQNSNDEYQ